MIVQLVALNVRRFAVCALTRLFVIVLLLSTFVSFAQIYATGVLNNVASKIWIIASNAQCLVVVALRHATKWPLDLKKPIGTNVRRNRKAYQLVGLYASKKSRGTPAITA
jgi:hypothetical protein